MVAAYTSTILLSALLLFMVEPMFAKMVMPILGGSPAVWTIAVVFYQSALLAGYVYAHGAIAWLGARRQAALHTILLLLPLLVLPIALPAGWNPPPDANPTLWMLALMIMTVGLPFFVLSASSPMLQKWFSKTSHPAANDPYFLYAASNLGSMVGLLAYPLLVEPFLGLKEQSVIWAAGYVVFALLAFACAVVLWRSRQTSNAAESGAAPLPAQAASVAPTGGVTILRRVRWVILAFVPSSLMLSVTTYFGTRIAPFPLLWVIPLGIYLLSFVLVFSPRNPIQPIWMIRLLPIAVLPLIITLTWDAHWSDWFIIPLHLLPFFVIAMVCHRSLADDRPHAQDLTEFYLWMSAGGALGGVFNSLLAPVIFKSVLEYPLVLVVACLIAPATVIASNQRRAQLLDVGLPVVLGGITVALALALQSLNMNSAAANLALVFCVPILICYSFSRRPLRFGLGVAALIIVGMWYAPTLGPAVLYQDRSFFGINTVSDDAVHNLHLLKHGDTLHGIQNWDTAERCQGLTYYSASGPIGQFFTAPLTGAPRKAVAVVGLGAGTLASYWHSGESWTFYEIDPSVERIARDPRYFTFLSACAPDARIVLGDARLSLASAPAAHFDVIVLDAYSSDSIPAHLITHEALQLYVDKLARGGILAFHISNRYFDLKPILGNLSSAAGLVAISQRDADVSAEEIAQGKMASEWVLMARTAADLGSLAMSSRWTPVKGNTDRLWTDDFSSIIWALRR